MHVAFQMNVRRRERFLPLALRLERRRFLVARRALRPLRADLRARLLGAMMRTEEDFLRHPKQTAHIAKQMVHKLQMTFQMIKL
jgi:hypothetical protein